MKSFTATSLLLAAATVASAVSSASALSTISRTSIHTTCPNSSAKKAAYYGNSTIPSSTESDIIQYETELYTKDSTVTLLSTSCSANHCEVTTVLESLTTVVATVNGVLTTYVTGVRITPNATPTAKPAKVAAAAAKPAKLIAENSSKVATNDNSASDVKPTTTSSPVDPTTTIGEDVTVTAPTTTVITITSCSHDICKHTAVTTGVTVVTTEVDGVKTVYTTYCPLSGKSTPTTVAPKKTDVVVVETPKETVVETSEAPKETEIIETPVPVAPVTVTKPTTTTITTISCKEDKCHEVPITTGVSAYTVTVNGFVTSYTTFCPLSSESIPAPVPDTPAVQESSAVVTPISESTVNVITNNIVTQSKTVSQSASPTPSIASIFEGAANRAVPAVLALPALYLLL